MTTLIDTHAHLYDDAFEADINEVIQRAIEAGISKMYLPNCDAQTLKGMLELCTTHPKHCFPMLGLHPVYVKENVADELASLKAVLPQHAFAAIGEIGLDYYWDPTFISQQKEAFSQQIGWANENNLPIVIHSRESTADCISVVKQCKSQSLKGIFHCYSGTLAEAQEIIAMGFYLGIGGAITYKKSLLPEIVKVIGLDNLVLETDAPYLAPVPFRGKRNESSYLIYVAEAIAQIAAVSVLEVMEVTTRNAKEIFL